MTNRIFKGYGWDESYLKALLKITTIEAFVQFNFKIL